MPTDAPPSRPAARPPDAGHASATFPTTRWSLLAEVGAGGGGGRAMAADACRRRHVLGVILRRYLPALRAHLMARGSSADAADDLLQAFVADKVIERDLLAHADRGRGRFRCFLVTSLDRFASNVRRHSAAVKRAPADRVLVLGPEVGLDPAGPAGADPFDVVWARAAMAEAVRRMREGCDATGRPDLWELFEARVLGPALDGSAPAAYGPLVQRLGYESPKAAANALVTAKRRFEQALRSVLAEHAVDEADLEQELASLGAALAGAAHARDAGPADNRSLREAARPGG